jgi:hypothetical protein
MYDMIHLSCQLRAFRMHRSISVYSGIDYTFPAWITPFQSWFKFKILEIAARRSTLEIEYWPLALAVEASYVFKWNNSNSECLIWRLKHEMAIFRKTHMQ